jgi:hypothetical protein
MAAVDRQDSRRPIDFRPALSPFGSKLTRTAIVPAHSKSQVELRFAPFGRCAEAGSTVRRDAGFFSSLMGVKDGNREQQIIG